MNTLITDNQESSQTEVRDLENPRLELLQKLGSKCSLCPETDERILQIDHKLGHGYLEKEYFDSKDAMYQYYLDNFEKESQYIQVLCFNCNTKKRIVNEEKRGRPSLKEYSSLYTDSKYIDAEKIKENIDDFLSKNPQFIPIHERFAPKLEKLMEFELKRRKLNQEITKISSEFPKSIHKLFELKVPQTDQSTDALIRALVDYMKNHTETDGTIDMLQVDAVFSDESNWSRKHVNYAINKMISYGLLAKTPTGEYKLVSSY